MNSLDNDNVPVNTGINAQALPPHNTYSIQSCLPLRTALLAKNIIGQGLGIYSSRW